MDPETGKGFVERGRFQVTAFTESRTDSAMLRERVPSVNVVVSWPLATSVCVRDVSVLPVKVRVTVSFDTRCTAPVHVAVEPPVVVRLPLREPSMVTRVAIFRTEDIG